MKPRKFFHFYGFFGQTEEFRSHSEQKNEAASNNRPPSERFRIAESRAAMQTDEQTHRTRPENSDPDNPGRNCRNNDPDKRPCPDHKRPGHGHADKKARELVFRTPGDLFASGSRYSVTRSSHLTMASMATIEIAQTTTKTLHVAEIEILP